MIKLVFEYTFINDQLISVSPNIIIDPSTTTLEKLEAAIIIEKTKS
jgi:hypothetical protein